LPKKTESSRQENNGAVKVVACPNFDYYIPVLLEPIPIRQTSTAQTFIRKTISCQKFNKLQDRQIKRQSGKRRSLFLLPYFVINLSLQKWNFLKT
jgi:hypothetical protein